MENKPQMPDQPTPNQEQSPLSPEPGNTPSGQDYSQMPTQPISNSGQSPLSPEPGNAPARQNYSQMLTQPISNQGQSAPSSEPGNVPAGQNYSQMLTQPLSNQRPGPGNASAGQNYQQIPPNQSSQQVSPLPNQGPVSDSQATVLPHVSHRGKGLTTMLLGVILAVGGIVLSVISYTSASSAINNGGTGNYIIFTGPIVIGIICAIVGFFRWILRR